MRIRHEKKDYRHLPDLLVSDGDGNFFEIPGLKMAGMAGKETVLPDPSHLIPLPDGSDMFRLPGSVPVGFDPENECFVSVPELDGEEIFAVAAFLAPAHLQFLLPAYEKGSSYQTLPLYAYTAAGWADGHVSVPAVRIDSDPRQDLNLVELDKIEKRAPDIIRRFPGNRLVEHLVTNCALCYGCPAARNFVMGRWECPVPTAPTCNAQCLGCISLQPEESGVPSTQERIAFVPTVDEIVEFTLPHLQNAPEPVISFGQGCEGEPLLYADLIAEAVQEIRKKTDRGIINLNTNGSLTGKVDMLCRAGLDSIRISLNSAQQAVFSSYYRPGNYTLDNVRESLETATGFGLWTSVNYFMFPGLTDTAEEWKALTTFFRNASPRMIQTRNMNIDPFLYRDLISTSIGPVSEPLGMPWWLKNIHEKYPGIVLGYFNPPRERMPHT